MRSRTALIAVVLTCLGLLGVAIVPATASPTTDANHSATASTAHDPFFDYTGSTPLADIAPGTILKTRTLRYHVIGIPTPVQAVQLLYRTTDAQQRPIANVTSVLKPLGRAHPSRAVSYQSFYDSLDPEDGPSRSIAGNASFGGAIADAESIFIVPLLAQGNAVIVPDTEGPNADFAAGPEYGTTTLDSIRAATHSDATGLRDDTKVAMIGYSGGAIATNWAAQLAPSYAPDVNDDLVGLAEGGLLVDPAHNLDYIDGSLVWAGVAPMAIIGVGRAYDIDFEPYLSDRGREVFAKLENASITAALGQYPGLKFRQLVKPQYADPNSIPAYVDAVNQLNMGSAASPTIPMFIGQGSNGLLEGTRGVGKGDGVMVAADVRALARQFCATGTPAVKYKQYYLTSHVTTAALWAPSALLYLNQRLSGLPAPSDCGHIPAGSSLAPETAQSH